MRAVLVPGTVSRPVKSGVFDGGPPHFESLGSGCALSDIAERGIVLLIPAVCPYEQVDSIIIIIRILFYR
jgi:hypothetical protein